MNDLRKEHHFSISLDELQHILFSHTYLCTLLSVAMKCPNKCDHWEGRMEENGEEGVERVQRRGDEKKCVVDLGPSYLWLTLENP